MESIHAASTQLNSKHLKMEIFFGVVAALPLDMSFGPSYLSLKQTTLTFAPLSSHLLAFLSPD